MNSRMGNRIAWWVAGSSLGIYTILLAIYLILPLSSPGFVRFEYWRDSLFIPNFSLMGLLILRRHPAQPIGWLFLVTSLAGAVQHAAGQYAIVSLTSDDSGFPAGDWAAWLAQIAQFLSLASVLYLLLLFPTGTLLSKRWRVVNWSLGAGVFTQLLYRAIYSGLLDGFSVANPAGLPMLAPYLETIASAGSPLLLIGVIGTVAMLIVRGIQAQGVERQQVKIFAFVAVIIIVVIALSGFAETIIPEPMFQLLGLVWFFGPSALAAAVAIAVLKYRLYDIDIIIRRTLQYALLTSLLGTTFFGIVVFLQEVLRRFNGEQNSPLVTVISTLGIAALFNPFRLRTQEWIDRRFYREKYNAEEAVAGFTSTARDEVDIDRLASTLVSVVQRTLRPDRTSLWLRTRQK